MPPLDYVDLRRQDLGLSTYRPQREWINGRGILLPIAHFFSGVGAGAWGFSLLFGYRQGLILALCVVGILSGVTHLLFLGRLERFWRMVKHPQTSWISRGLWGIAIFLLGGTGYVLIGPGETLLGRGMLGLSLIGMVIILLYEGFVYSASRAIPFWNTRLIPVLYVAYGLRGGLALLLIAASLGSRVIGIDAMETIKLWVVVSTAVLILLLLLYANRIGGAARHSAHELLAGRISPAFYGGTIAVGIVVPLVLGSAEWLEGFGLPVIGIVGAASLIGDFYVKFCVVKAGIYAPLTGSAGGRALETAR